MSSDKIQGVPQGFGDVLLISPFESDHLQLAAILKNSGWRQHSARNRAVALDFLRGRRVPVVICESELPDGTWMDVFAELGRMAHAPLLVVTSRLADERLWSEALNLGAYNVLAKPLNSKEVLHVVSLAALLWQRQWEYSQPLARTA